MNPSVSIVNDLRGFPCAAWVQMQNVSIIRTLADEIHSQQPGRAKDGRAKDGRAKDGRAKDARVHLRF